ncbi:hypothetical protein [Sulfitobacter donghicola]|uniref:Uncharacterized protein n=1 Tax=Sulfitobacter donghicola DSW-25 = KCTC 12864 = JCM 14565 TaxID=1300350 RepID=A0A073IM28_9RHOB|nr:hypothetical protein [Sulfitobacter donghicola]KEJ90521.1 hypothetical protein DSW25_00975 [Sulfitobacter donghicola DSW-25 = KCTC 12864 = JCM 14565]KIN67763.1 hypothetical protein Z948_1485 [Sulfitobacter donghicola DSW-25 = KCTC 12864 = JCM 14565]
MRALVLFLIGLTFGAAGGFVVAAANGIVFEGHDHSDPAHHAGMAGMDHAAMGHGDMDHEMMHDQPLEVDAAHAPVVEITVHQDPMDGFNLHVITQNFTFSPRSASLAHTAGEGHAHVYANGVKLGRLYGSWMHLTGLPKGEVEIEVTLNTNDHRPLSVDGTPVAAKTTVTVE